MPLERRTSRTLLVFSTLLLGFILYCIADPKVFTDIVTGSISIETWNHSAFLSFLQTYGYFIAIAYVVLVAILVFFENRNPDRTLTWLLVLGIFPIIGIALYWIVGPNFRYIVDKRRIRVAKFKRLIVVPVDDQNVANPLADSVATVIYSCSEERVYGNGTARILGTGDDTFTSMLASIAKAKRTIMLESYIVRNDILGRKFKDALIERAKAGVTVCLLYDAVGSWFIGSEFIEELRVAGVRTHAFLPVSFPMFRGANYRNHRKILVVDHEVAYIGGFNIGDEYLGRDKKWGFWRDTHMEIKGEAVFRIAALFMKDLSVCSRGAAVEQAFAQCALLARKEMHVDKEKSARREISVSKTMHVDAEKNACNGTSAGEEIDGAKKTGTSKKIDADKEGIDLARPVLTQIASSGPDSAWDTILKAYITLIGRAEHRVFITTPYLVPADTLVKAITTCSLSGIDVRILIPAKVDSLLAEWACHNVLEELLRSGVRVYLYAKDRFVHAKTITCDGLVFTAGSANLDTRSLNINFEIQGFFYDADLAQQAEQMFLEDLLYSKELDLDEWTKRPFIQKIQENIGKLFSSLT